LSTPGEHRCAYRLKVASVIMKLLIEMSSVLSRWFSSTQPYFFLLLPCLYEFHYFLDGGLGQWKGFRNFQIHQNLITSFESRNKESGYRFFVWKFNGMCIITECLLLTLLRRFKVDNTLVTSTRQKHLDFITCKVLLQYFTQFLKQR